MLSEIQQRLGAIPKLTLEQKQLLSRDGYIAFFQILCKELSKFEAFEILELYFFEIFGYHKYSDYDSFRKIYSRYSGTKFHQWRDKG
jgi:hypothetical protein